MSFPFFLRQLVTGPALLIIVLLTLGVIYVNGITDMPNTIAICVSTRSPDVNLVIATVAVYNCAGVVVITMMNSAVTVIITNMVNFGEDISIALVTLCAAFFSTAVWSSFAASTGYPTSENHAPIAGPVGVAVAIHGGFSAINPTEWMEVVYGLISSVVLGFLSGYLPYKLVVWTCRDIDRRKTTGLFRYAQVDGTAVVAFMHGTQGGQKFMGVMLLGICMVNGSSNTQEAWFPLWMPLLGSAAIALGTFIGGEKIIRSVSMDMVRLEKYQGFSTDMAGAACLLGFSTFGVPTSTTHTKTTAIMGAGAAKRLLAISFSAVKDMVMTWVMTFPGYGIVGFLIAKLFMVLFHG